MIRKWCVYKLKEAKKRRIATLRPLLTDGIVPEPSKCEEDDDTDSGISSHDTASNTMPSPDLSKTELARRLSLASLRNPANLKVKVLWDFEPRLKNTELKVVKGEIIHLLYRDNDKVLAVNSHGKRGFIPFNYCSLPHRKIDANLSKESLSVSTRTPSKPRKQLYSDVSFHQFLDDMDLRSRKSSGKHTKNLNTQLDFKSLQKKSFSEEGLFGNISSSSDENEDESSYFRKTTEIHNMIRWNPRAPESFRQRHKVTVSHFRKCDEVNMLVLYDFVAQDENDIDVYKGDIVRVLNRDDRDWWWVVTRSGYEGFVPCSYLTRRSIMPSTGQSTTNSIETSSSTSEGSSTQAVRFQDPLCTFHRYEKEEWETDSEASIQHIDRFGLKMVKEDEQETVGAKYIHSKWSTWC